MTVLDTNVLSEVLKPVPSSRVLRWLAAQPRHAILTTSLTQAELLHGVEALPAGKRRSQLLTAVEEILREDFVGRILPFDEAAAREYAAIVVSRDSRGRPISQFDAMIAAITRSRGAVLATRNIKHFQDCGIRVIDPWR